MLIGPRGLYLLDASSTCLQVVARKSSSDIAKGPLGAKSPWVENPTHILYSTNVISGYPWKGPFYTIRQSWKILKAIWPVLKNCQGPVRLSWALPVRPIQSSVRCCSWCGWKAGLSAQALCPHGRFGMFSDPNAWWQGLSPALLLLSLQTYSLLTCMNVPKGWRLKASEMYGICSDTKINTLINMDLKKNSPTYSSHRPQISRPRSFFTRCPFSI